MSNKNRLPFAAATRLGNKLLEIVRSRYFMFVTIMMLLLGVASPAQAAEVFTATNPVTPPNFMCYIGAPSLDIFDPAQSVIQRITGIILGIVIAVGFFGLIFSGLRILAAGKNTDKAADGVIQARNSLFGTAMVFGGILFFGIFITLLVSIVPWGC